MNATWRAVLWHQFGAAIDMLDNAIRDCPEEVWADRSRQPEYWFIAYHTLFFLDLYLSSSTDGFAPPAPFTLSELDFEGVLPDRVYRKEELQLYLDHGRRKCKARIDALTEDSAWDECTYGWIEMSVVESLLYNLRHVQHHAAQLNLILRQRIDSAPGWVARGRDEGRGQRAEGRGQRDEGKRR
jgi:hypothetical protein